MQRKNYMMKCSNGDILNLNNGVQKMTWDEFCKEINNLNCHKIEVFLDHITLFLPENGDEMHFFDSGIIDLYIFRKDCNVTIAMDASYEDMLCVIRGLSGG